MVLYADQLREGDQVSGYGQVAQVREHHHPGCPGGCEGRCTRIPRMVVLFDGDPSDYVFTTMTELLVDRPERDCEPEPEPELTGGRW